MTSLISFFRRLLSAMGTFCAGLWTRYRALSPRMQWIVGILLAVLVIVFFSIIRSGGAEESTDTPRAVSVEAVGSLSSGEGSATLFGSVRSITEAEVVAKTSGTVEAVYVRIGQSVGAGAILASMDNDSEAAAVLSAEGAYEAALAARSITQVQGGSTETDARNIYRSAYTTIDSAFENYVDPLISGVDRASGVTIDQAAERKEIKDELAAWRRVIDSGVNGNILPLLTSAEATALKASAFLDDFSRTVNADDSGVSATNRAGYASARVSINTARDAINGARTAVGVSERQTDSTSSSTATADAQVKQALGALRSAQANFERTVVRSPIAGTVNFLPIRVGDYVIANTHAATVARNGALEITAFVSEEDRALLAVGDAVRIDDNANGTITSIAPALDPVSKQIEVRIAAENTDGLVNGQSVRVTLMSEPKPEAPTGPLTLPLSAVKLSSGSRVVFSIGEDMRLVAHPVEVGQVRGDRIEITSELPLELPIVRDARGLSAGQEVRVATNS